ncbi:MAG: hypothetical protein GY869_27655 [Planctomycetes bacterium]|nr:hypothetical protein [Planctomycetota bacterium]
MLNKIYKTLLNLLMLTLILSTISIHASTPEFIAKTEFSLTGSFPAHPDPAPCFADWDGDGLLDLLVGVYIGDGNSNTMRMQLYLNTGSVEEPDFQFSKNLEADGAIIDPYWY